MAELKIYKGHLLIYAEVLSSDAGIELIACAPFEDVLSGEYGITAWNDGKEKETVRVFDRQGIMAVLGFVKKELQEIGQAADAVTFGRIEMEVKYRKRSWLLYALLAFVVGSILRILYSTWTALTHYNRMGNQLFVFICNIVLLLFMVWGTWFVISKSFKKK